MRIILSSLLTVMFLVACGGSDTSPTPTPFATASPPASAATAVPKPTEGTALEVTAVAKPTEATAPEATTDHADLNSKEYERNDAGKQSVNDSNLNDNKSDVGKSSSQVDNWRETYNLPYTISCIDDRLGVSVTREFQTGLRGPTQKEMDSLASCELASNAPVGKSSTSSSQNSERVDDKGAREDESDDMNVRERIESIKAVSGGWIRTGNPMNDQYAVGYIPTADEWRCGIAAVGVDILRDIRSGEHTITDEENRKLTPCFRASPDSITHPYAQLWEGHCIPLDLLQEVIDYYRPSWEQLECHLEELERYEMPSQVRYLMLDRAFGIRNNKSFLYPQHWDRIMTDPYYEDLRMNFSPSQSNIAMPPYYDWEYNDIKCHNSREDEYGNLVLDDYWLDESLRGAAVGYIIEKKKGRRIFADVERCSNHYVVQGDPADYGSLPINSVDDYKKRALDIVIPGYILQAKAAEKVKAEMMQIGGIQAEVEVIFSMNEFLGNLPPDEQVELAQWLIDRLIPEVRKYFKGMIWATSATSYDSGDSAFPLSKLNSSFGPHWKNLSFAAADHVSFTITLSCDFRHVERYLGIQFDNIQEIIQRDKLTWSTVGDAGATGERLFGPEFDKRCNDDLGEKELEIHELLQSYIDDFPTKPYFLPIPQPPRSWTKEDEGYSPTISDAGRGDWKFLSLDEAEVPEEIREFWMEYARKNVID